MKISNKSFILILIVVVIILLGWSWLNQKGFLSSNNNTTLDSETKENINAMDLENSPRLRITFPGNQAVLNPGLVVIRYALSGNLDEVERIDFTLFKEGKMLFHQSGSFSKTEKAGSKVFPDLEEGEYRLMARLLKNDNTYFNTPFSESVVSFIVKENTTANK